jgi:hypothetical protein
VDSRAWKLCCKRARPVPTEVVVRSSFGSPVQLRHSVRRKSASCACWSVIWSTPETTIWALYRAEARFAELAPRPSFAHQCLAGGRLRRPAHEVDHPLQALGESVELSGIETSERIDEQTGVRAGSLQ